MAALFFLFLRVYNMKKMSEWLEPRAEDRFVILLYTVPYDMTMIDL